MTAPREALLLFEHHGTAMRRLSQARWVARRLSDEADPPQEELAGRAVQGLPVVAVACTATGR
jgi:hypothetical protein